MTALPSDTLTPETTNGREGFIHPYSVSGSAAQAELRLIIRDFDDGLLDEHINLLKETAEKIISAEPHAELKIKVTHQYPNMRRYIDEFPQVVSIAEEAIRAEGIELKRTPIRGGTDGSSLSAMGLPTPNIFTGGYEYHSVREWASLREMAAATAVIVHLAELWTNKP